MKELNEKTKNKNKTSIKEILEDQKKKWSIFSGAQNL